MYVLRYLVPTASGDTSEKTLKLESFPEYEAALNQFKKFGYTVIVNSMCVKCVHFKDDCSGSVNHVYDGCAARETKLPAKWRLQGLA